MLRRWPAGGGDGVHDQSKGKETIAVTQKGVPVSSHPALLCSTHAHSFGRLPTLLTSRTLYAKDPQMCDLMVTQAGLPDFHLQLPTDASIWTLKRISDFIFQQLISNIISKSQNLLLSKTSQSQEMAALIFQLLRLKPLEISLSPLSHIPQLTCLLLTNN